MKRIAPLVVLFLFAILGVFLVATAGDGSGPQLESVTTADGVVVDIPAGWVSSTDVPIRYEPPGADLSNVDSWTVAWACGPDGCATRTLDEWRAVGNRLETLTRARADNGSILADLVETDDGNAHVMRAVANGGQTIVSVAVFNDGADHYLECNLAVLGDPAGLDDAIVKACKSAKFPS